MIESASKNEIVEHLEALSKWLSVFSPGVSFDFVVVGGAALALQGLRERTFDIDLLQPEVFPDALKRGIEVVARSRNIGSDWLNASVANILKTLKLQRHRPLYFTRYEQNIPIGDNLRVHTACRQTLISLKLFAASASVAKHTEDLRLLEPSKREIKIAKKFVRSLDASDPREADMEFVLSQLGFNFGE